MKKVNKYLKSVIDPLIPLRDRMVPIQLIEHEWRPNPNEEATIALFVSKDSVTYDLGECRFIDHELVEGKLNELIHKEDERLSAEAITQLRAIVETTRATSLEQTPLWTHTKKRRKPKKAEQPTETSLTLLLTPSLPISGGPSNSEEFAHENLWYWSASTEELRSIAFDEPKGNSSVGSNRHRYSRAVAVRVYVQLRAKGICEGCRQPAPFINANGQPYLESHHTIPVSEGGPDHPCWVVALCPSCHRRAHYAGDAHEFNKGLILIANQLESGKLRPNVL